MAGRIRSLKPEWLEDELLVESSAEARVLSAALILLADDYGNGRGGLTYLHSRTFPGQDRAVTEASITRLQEIRFASFYEVDGQRYFTIRNWKKHQKVDKPGKPLVPPPPGTITPEPPKQDTDLVYFVQQGKSGHIKIGRSWNPVDRVRKLSTGSSANLTLLGVIDGGYQERELHRRFDHLRVKKNGEWFRAAEDLVSFIRDCSRPVREQDANSPEQDGDDSEPFAPDRDRRPGPGPTTGTDDHDRDARGAVVAPPKTPESDRDQTADRNPDHKVRCPVPIPLDDDSFGGFKLNLGLERRVAEVFLLDWAAKQHADTEDLRPLGKWLKCAVAAVQGEWSRDKSGMREAAERADTQRDAGGQTSRERELEQQRQEKLRRQTEEARAQLARAGKAPERDVGKLVGGIGGA